MATYGTVGYVKNRMYYGGTVFAISSNEDAIRDAFDLYLYIIKFGPASFAEEMNKIPNGLQSISFNINTGLLEGKPWEGNWGDNKELEHEKSPYSNLWYDFDDKTINFDSRYNGDFWFKVVRKDWCWTKKSNKKILFDSITWPQEVLFDLLSIYKNPSSWIIEAACSFYLKIYQQV